MATDGITGLALAAAYYEEVVAPLVLHHFPRLRHAAARLGSGSEILGLDDGLSQDHDWGLRLTLLVDADAVAPVDDMLTQSLPESFRDRPTRFETTRDPQPRHRVEVATVGDFTRSRLGCDATTDLSATDWLCLTGQSVVEVVSGAVFHDSSGEFTAARRRLAWYPDDVWRYAVAAAWSRIAEDLPLMGRTGQRGDEAGSRQLAVRIVGTATHLTFLLCRSWPPYPKWRGLSLARLPSAALILPKLDAVLAATSWRNRQETVQDVLIALLQLQGEQGVAKVGADDPTEPFYDRPFLGIRAEVIAALRDRITDPAVLAWPAGIGTVEQWIDSVPVLTDPARRVAAVCGLFGPSIAQ